MSRRLDRLRAHRDRNDPAQQDEFYRLNALEVWRVKLPKQYDPTTYVLYLEPVNMDGTGGMVAQLANSRAAEAFVKDGRLWLQGFFATTRATPEGRPRRATGMSEQAAEFLRRYRGS